MSTSRRARRALIGAAVLVCFLAPSTAFASEVCVGPAAWTSSDPSNESTGESLADDSSWVGGLSGISFVPQRDDAPGTPASDDILFWCTGENETQCFPERAPTRHPLSWESTSHDLASTHEVDSVPHDGPLPEARGAAAILGPRAGIRTRLERPPR